MKNQINLLLVLLCVCAYVFTHNEVNCLRGKRSSGHASPVRKSPRTLLNEAKKSGTGIMQGYYGSWNSQGVAGSSLKDTNPNVSMIYISFARIDLQYDVNRAFNTRQNFLTHKHGLEYTNFAALVSAVGKIRKARPDVILILALGGETYMIDIEKEIDYVDSIVKFLDDFDLDGVDIDWEPNSSFNLLNEEPYSNYYIKLVETIRSHMPAEKLISISGSSNAAISCYGVRREFCSDNDSPYNIDFVEKITTENPDLFFASNMLSTGTFVNIFKKAGDKIDLVFIQTYNLDGVNIKVMVDMYLSHLYYGIKHDITVILGFSLEKNRGSFPADNMELLKLVGDEIREQNKKNGRADGVGVWHLFMGSTENTAASVDIFFKEMWKHINPGKPERTDVAVEENVEDCDLAMDYIYGHIVTENNQVFKHNDCIWKNNYYSMLPPGSTDARYEWSLVKPCYEKACNGKAYHYYETNYQNGDIVIWKGEAFELISWAAGPPEGEAASSYRKLEPSECPDLAEWNAKYPHKEIEKVEDYEQEKDM